MIDSVNAKLEMKKKQLLQIQKEKELKELIQKEKLLQNISSNQSGDVVMSENKIETTKMGSQESEIPEEEVEKLYQTQLSEMRFDTCQMVSESGNYMHHYTSNISSSGAGSTAKMTKLSNEIQSLGFEEKLFVV